MADPRASLATLRVIHAALFASCVLYVAIGWILTHQPGAAPRALDPTLLYALAGVAVATASLIPVLRRALLPPMREPASIDDRPAEGKPGAGDASARYLRACIVTWALCESIAVYGLILTLLSGVPSWVAIFALGALANMALYPPRKAQLEAVLRAAGERAPRA